MRPLVLFPFGDLNHKIFVTSKELLQYLSTQPTYEKAHNIEQQEITQKIRVWCEVQHHSWLGSLNSTRL